MRKSIRIVNMLERTLFQVIISDHWNASCANEKSSLKQAHSKGTDQKSLDEILILFLFSAFALLLESSACIVLVM